MPEIYIKRTGAIGRITLSRPEALNSLTAKMLSKIEIALDNWENDPAIAAVVVDAEGDKAFCAGGDITDIYKQGKKKNYRYGQKFWADEYRLNLKIARYKKPYLAFMQGFTMGGGVGISCHGSHRIVGENSIISMPECGIGLVPDVGGSFLLARLEKNVGAYLGTTAFRMDAGDSIFCKFADHYIPIEQWPHTIKELATHGDVEYAINKYQRETPKSQLRQIVPIIEEVMQPNDYSRLEERMSKYSQLAIGLNNLKRNSPLSVAFTYSMLKMPEVSRDIESALGIEYRYTSRAQEETDFLEGIRAMVIDKDRAPQWKHKSLSEVKIEEITALLAPLNN